MSRANPSPDTDDETSAATSSNSSAPCRRVDDIECLHGRVPRWWTGGFVACLAFAPVYMFFHHNGVEGRSSIDNYERAMAINMNGQLEALEGATMDADGVARYLDDDSWLAVGRSLYKTHCASCHGAAGGGIVGPNLCDDSYKNIRDLGGFIRVLVNGAGGGAMPAWKDKLDDKQIVLVSSYVASLRGSNPPGGRPPEGRVIPPWN